jgi:hypothetical protein
MIFKFNSLYDYKNELYTESNIVVILGSYPIFNNIVSDRLKKSAIPEFLHSNMGSDLSDEFIASSSNDAMNNISLDEFIRNKDTYPMMGKWFCIVNYNSSLTKAHKDFIHDYISKSKDSGILVINCSDFREYKYFKRSGIIKNSKNVNLIDLSYPDRGTLKLVILDLLAKLNNGNKIQVSEKALDLFIMRLGNDYNGYYSILQVIANDFKHSSVGYDDIMHYIKNVDNYNLDDFIERLVTTKTTDKFVKTRKVYRAYYSLCESIGVKRLIYRLSDKIDAIIEMRYLINIGTVPILVRYGAKSIQSGLEDDSKLKNLSSFSFKKLARIASLTSLRDWFYIRMMLNKYDKTTIRDTQGEQIMHSIIHRNAFSSNRINNDIAILDDIENLYSLNKIRYSGA